MKTYTNRHMATCVPGMESVLADEIRNANNITISRGKVTFDCECPEMLKCADNLYKLYRLFPIGPHKTDLENIGKFLRDLDFSVSGRIIVSASRTGKHTYSRFDVAQQIETALVSTGKFTIGDNLNHDLAIRVDVSGATCAVYKQLTSAQMRFRSDDFQSAPGGIRPSVAHCLVRLSEPKNDDVFYDPFCGAGTIPFERAAYKSKKIYASDYDESVLETARLNLGSSAIVFSADATKTKMKNHSVNKIVTNMPWGKQIKLDDGLYYNFILELKRILTPDGKAIILTDQVSAIEKLCGEQNLNCSRITELSLHGLHPVVFLIAF
ncbi:MAG: RNA methyltransferase [Oscillospiraceae bacterium]|nr:RNA methyltransferase [Oscillospiraceae bacterium]